MGNHGIHGSVELNAALLVTPEFPLGGNVVDMVVLDGAECAAHVTYNAVLTAIMNGVVAYNVGADLFLAPTCLQTHEHGFNRVYENLLAADNMTCWLLIVTVDCSGKYPWADADGYTELTPGSGKTFEAMANMQNQVAAYNAIPCCDLFHSSGINPHTWAWFSARADPVNHNYSPYRLDETGKPVSMERIRYVMGESYYQIRDGKVVLEKYDARPPYP